MIGRVVKVGGGSIQHITRLGREAVGVQASKRGTMDRILDRSWQGDTAMKDWWRGGWGCVCVFVCTRVCTCFCVSLPFLV